MPGKFLRFLTRAAAVQVAHEITTVVGKFRDLALTPVTMVRDVARMVKGEKDTSTSTLSILSDCKGTLLPGTMTLLLAPPGHGKTCFLKALAGRLPTAGMHGRRGAAAAAGRRRLEPSGFRCCFR